MASIVRHLSDSCRQPGLVAPAGSRLQSEGPSETHTVGNAVLGDRLAAVDGKVIMVRLAEGAPRFETRDVLVMGAAVEPSGLRVLRVAVGDESDDAPPARDARPADAVVAAAAAWRSAVGRGSALPNLYVPAAPRLSLPGSGERVFDAAEIDPASRRWLTSGVDARALRTRARILQWLAVRSATDAAGTLRWASLGSGPAFGVFGAMAQAARQGVRTIATVIDVDEAMLAVDRGIARLHDMSPDQHLFTTRADAMKRAPLAPESQDLVDALGLLDGRDSAAAVAGLARAFSLVRPGGVLVFAVMLAGRTDPSDADVLGQAAAMLTLDDVAALLADAGIPVMDAMVHLPHDSIYAVVEVTAL